MNYGGVVGKSDISAHFASNTGEGEGVVPGRGFGKQLRAIFGAHLAGGPLWANAGDESA